MNKILLLSFVVLTLFSCKPNEGELPYLGNKIVEDGETIYHTIRDWTYLNQDSVEITNTDMGDYVYIADFFFTSCPSICPKVAKEMHRIYDAYEDDPRVKLVSFTLDPKRDDVNKLNLYASNLGIETNKWMLLTGDKDFTLDLADDYFVAAYEDADVPGGFDHSGKIILVDKSGHVRSFSEGTDPSSTPKIIRDVERLLAEYP